MGTDQAHQEVASTPAEVPASVSSSLPAKKMGKLRASYLLTIEGLELLKKDKQVLLFPIFSAFASIALLSVFCILYRLLDGGFFTNGTENTSSDFGSVGYGTILLLYLTISFVTTFFHAGLTAVVGARINGRSMPFRDGVSTAKAHAEKIFLWSLVAATVGVVLALISDLSKWLGKIVAFFLSASWGIITFFIVPALILEEGNVSDAIKSSAGTFKKTWGETLVINFSASLFLTLVAFLGIVLSVLLIVFLPPLLFILLPLLIIFLIGIAVLSSAINSIFRVVLYEYAKAGHVADTFAPELILGAIKKKEL